MVIVIILYRRNTGSDRHIAIFSAVFVTIQLLEFFAWLSIEKKDRKLNDLVTRLILIALWAQPLVNTYMAFKGVNSWLLIIGLVTFSFFFINSFILASSPEPFKTSKGPNCHLTWSRTEDGKELFIGDSAFMSNWSPAVIIYLAGLFIPILFIKPKSRAVKIAIIGGLTLGVSKLFSSKREFSSWWCWAAGIFTLGAVFIQK